MGEYASEHEARLAEKLAELSAIVNLQAFMEGRKNTPRKIGTYFRLNRRAYRRHHSPQGFMHFHVNPDGRYREDGIYYQPDTVSRRITPGARVLELGFGQGTNLFYLAKRHPDAQFTGVDIIPTNPPCALPNIDLRRLDYADLSAFPDDTFDVVYAFEAIVYSSDKPRVFREAWRVMKPGGALIVYDYALKAPFERYSPTLQTVITLLSKCGNAEIFESRGEWEAHIEQAGFQKARATDLGQGILPCLDRLNRKAGRLLARGSARRFLHLMPKAFVGNVIMGYLGADANRAGIAYYMEWIYRKP